MATTSTPFTATTPSGAAGRALNERMQTISFNPETVVKISTRDESFPDPFTPLPMGPSFYRSFTGVNTMDIKGFKRRKLACSISQSVVGLSCRFAYRPLFSSGTIIDLGNEKMILTSAYILGEHAADKPFSFKIEVYLPSRNSVSGEVVFVDQHHNFALIRADLDDTKFVTLSPQAVELGEQVVAVGRFGSDFEFVASGGEVNIRCDHLESDDLLSSSCGVSECGIGGPLINLSGDVIGMNFYCSQRFTPFIPITLLVKYVEHFKAYGKVVRPWLGIRTKGIEWLNVDELESLYRDFPAVSGIIVREVRRGSPAERAGLCVGDIICDCNGTPITSPIQFAKELFKVAESSLRLHRSVKRRRKVVDKIVKVGLLSKSSSVKVEKGMLIESLSPVKTDSWPVKYPLPKNVGGFFH